MHVADTESRTPPFVPAADDHAPAVWAAVCLIVIYFALQIATAAAFTLVAGAVTENLAAMLKQPAMQTLMTMFSLGVAASLTALLAHRKWPQLWSLAKPPGFGFGRPPRPPFLVLAVAAGLAAPLLGGLLTQWLAHSHAVTQDIRQLGGSTPLGLRLPLVLMVVSVGPLVEEMLFRGVLLSALLRRWHVGWAVAASSLVFALIHLPGLQFQWYALPALALLALTLTWLRLYSGSIWPAVLAHATNNLLAVAVWFVVPGLSG